MTPRDENPTPDDTGKPVVDSDGTRLGVVADVEDGTVSVDPDPDLADEFRTLLGGDAAEETYALRRRALHRDPSADLAVSGTKARLQTSRSPQPIRFAAARRGVTAPLSSTR